MSGSIETTGRIIIAPQVLTTVVRQATLSTEGVQRLGARALRRLKQKGRRTTAPGIEMVLTEGEVQVAVHIIADPGANMMRLAERLQTEITRAIEHIVGMHVTGVDVYIDDVSVATPAHPAP